MSMLIGEFTAWHRQKGHSKNTARAYEQDLTQLHTFLGKPVEEATEGDLWRYMTWLTDEVKAAPASRSRKVHTLRSFYKFVSHVKHIRQDNPAQELDVPKLTAGMPKYLNLDEMEKIKQSVVNDPFENAVTAVMYATGVRVSELVGMNRQDIDWKGHRVRITGKGDKVREIPISPTALDALKVILEGRTDDNPAVFYRMRKRVCVKTIQRITARAASNANISRISVSPHKFRHTWATQLRQTGVPLDAIGKWAGHSNLNTTSSIYAKILTSTEDKMYADNIPQGM